MPPPYSHFPTSSSKSFFLLSSSTSSSFPPPFSSSFSPSCRPNLSSGKRCVLHQCYDNKANEWVTDDKCSNLPSPPSLCSKCRDFTSCPAVWSISGWTPCSRTCGRGYQYRSVSCIKPVDALNLISVPYDECPGNNIPTKIAHCAVKDCPPRFVTSKWGPVRSRMLCKYIDYYTKLLLYIDYYLRER